MGKHETGFALVERDLYPTPAWVVTDALAEHVDLADMRVWEPACGTGQMSEALKAAGASVYSSDVEDYGYVGLDAVLDFVARQHPNTPRFSAIVTNPPFGNRGSLAEQFIAVGLQQIAEYGFMALLLPADFEFGKDADALLCFAPRIGVGEPYDASRQDDPSGKVRAARS